MMKIGVVCEGPTDFHAIEVFFRDALKLAGIDAIFEDIQPKMDNTRAYDGGWAAVLTWLQKNPPKFRIQNYFSGGFFEGFGPTYDAILIHLDTDIIGEESFTRFTTESYHITIPDHTEPEDRFAAIDALLEIAGLMNECTEADAKRHVFAPAVEATEAWCIGAFYPTHLTPPEKLRSAELTNRFMTALERFENRQIKAAYANCDKDVNRRKNFCLSLASSSARLSASSPTFGIITQRLLNASPAAI